MLTEYEAVTEVTEGLDIISEYGLTLQATDDDRVKIFGTATAVRNYGFLNGQNFIAISSTTGLTKTLEAGTYIIEHGITGFQTEYVIRGTYGTFADYFKIASASTEKKIIFTFTQPVTIAFASVANREYGTEENASYLSVSITRLTAIDTVARARIIENVVQYTEQTLSAAEAEQARVNIDSIGNDTLYTYNFYDAVELGNGESGYYYGITYTRNVDNSWTISGTASAKSFKNIISSSSKLPRYIIPGRKYKFGFNGGIIPVHLYLYREGETILSKIYTSDFDITMPKDMTGIIVRFEIAEGDTIDNETVKYTLIPETSTSIDNHYTYNITEEKTENIYNNAYTIETTPMITTDVNGWLQAVDTDTTDETGKTDMTGAIMSMLTATGYCHLGEGIFYVSGNIDMPAGSMLCGCGNKTVVRLLGSVSTGYIVRMKEYCTIRDICFSGSPSSLSPTSDGKRNAIHFTANYDGLEGETASTTNQCMINNVWIRNFSGSGIYCHNSAISVSKGLYAANIFILRCYIGINIDYYSEFGKFTNICTSSCYIGCVNNGGNNVFTACTFGATSIGFYIDGSMPNAAHGTLNGCTFCHVGSNDGYAIKTVDIAGGFIIANCQIWYCGIDIARSRGVLFDSCEFGRGRESDGSVCASINIDGGDLVMFSGCIFNLDVTRPPKITITNNTKTVFSGCYGTESGLLISA